MNALAGPVTASAVLLVMGGVSKVRQPGHTVHALRALRLPGATFAVRLLAFAEIGIGIAALVKPGRLTLLLVAVSYLGFACFVLLAMARGGPVSSCGCFSASDTAPTPAHVLVTLSASALAFVAAFADPAGPLLDGLKSQPLLGAPFVVLTACCVWFAYAAVAVLPTTSAFVTRRV